MYAPYGTPREQLTVGFLSQSPLSRQSGTGNRILQRLNPAWVALAEIVYRIEKQAYHMPVGRVIFQKIAYVATALGIPTELKYTRGTFGPYSRELDEVKKRLSNTSLIQEQKSGNMFRVLPGLAYEKDREKYKEDINKWNDLIDKTVDLFLRLDTNQAEIVATVLFVEKEINKRPNIAEKDVLNEVMKWKQKRLPPLSEHEVAMTIRNLGVLKWFHVQPSSDLPVDEF
jgi:uncharacterized protein YwgA